MAQHPRTDWEKVTSDLRKSKTSKADQSDAPPTNLSLDLDSIMPESGQAEDVANVPTLKLAEPDVLPDAALTPEGQSLRDFQSTLTNTPEERANVSNLMQFWERIPRYNCSDIQGINNSPDAKEMGIVNYSFEDSGEHYTLEMTPAQIRTEANGVQQTIFCYPDNTDELVELALVKLAMDNGDILQPADISHKPAKGHAALPSYGVYFTINQLIQQLKHWGRGRSYPALMRSLEVLNKCNLSVRSTSKGGSMREGRFFLSLCHLSRMGLMPMIETVSGRQGFTQLSAWAFMRACISSTTCFVLLKLKRTSVMPSSSCCCSMAVIFLSRHLTRSNCRLYRRRQGF